MPDEKYKQALSDIDKALEVSGDPMVFYRLLLKVNLLYQQHEASILAANKLAKIASDKGNKRTLEEAIMDRSTAYQRLNRTAEALKDLEELVRISPQQPDYYNNLGALYEQMKEYKKAHETIDKGLKIAPNQRSLRLNKGYIYLQEGKHKEAIKLFTKMIQDGKGAEDQAYVYSNRGEAYTHTGKLKEAMKDIEESLKIYPQNAYAYRNRGLLHLKMKKPELACQDFQKAKELGFQNMYGDEVEELLKKNCQK